MEKSESFNSISCSSYDYICYDGDFEELSKSMRKGEIVILQFCEDFLITRLELIIKYFPKYYDLLTPILLNIDLDLEIYFKLDNDVVVAEIIHQDISICYFYDVLTMKQFCDFCYILKEFVVFVLEENDIGFNNTR